VPSELLCEIEKGMQKMLYFFLASFFVLWWTTSFGAGMWAFMWRSSLLGLLGVLSFFQSGLLSRKIEKELEKVIEI
jgi:uncharacterized membrane protein